MALSPLAASANSATSTLHSSATSTMRSSATSTNANAYGHVIAPGYIEKNGTTTVTGYLPAGIEKRLGASTSTRIENLAPMITLISSPATLVVGQTGNWTVTASDPNNDALKYRASWGDSFFADFWNFFRNSYTASSTFTHSYSSPGTYTVKFTVKDAHGLTNTARVSVMVTASTTASL